MAKTKLKTKTNTSWHGVLGDPTKLGRDFKKRLKAGELLLAGTVIEYLRTSLIKIYIQCGFDFIFIDKEHTFLDGPELSDFVQSARDNGVPVISKVGELTRHEVARLLEAGVTGIQLPRSESREQMLELIDYMQFPPKGTRAAAPCYGNVDYCWPNDDRTWLRKANESVVAVAHIETAAGYENAEAIISTPGLGLLYVGPYDFSISMGQPGDYDHPAVAKPMERILQICRKYKVPFGTTASGPQAAKRWISKGAQWFEMSDEMSMIQAAGSQIVAAYR